MQIQRTLLFVAIGVVTYLMILAWKDDFSTDNTPTSSAVAESSQAGQQDNDFPDSSDAPEITVGDELNNDLPQVIEKQQDHIVTVKTDVYNIEIDLNGGDITKVALIDYPKKVDTPEDPFVLMDQDRHYAAQSGFAGQQGTHGGNGNATWVTDSNSYELLDGQDKLVIKLQVTQESGTVITRELEFERGSYHIKNQYTVDNSHSDAPWRASLFGQITRDGSGDPSKATAGFAPMPTYLGAAYWAPDKPYNKITLSDMKDSNLNAEHTGGWIAFIQHYFVSAWVPDHNQKYKYSTVYQPARDRYILRFISPALEVQPGQIKDVEADLFIGPKLQDELKTLSPGLHMTVDYGWLWFISQPIFAVLIFLQSGNISIFGKQISLGFGVGNWGVAIILLTLFIKLLFFKLSATSYRSMARMRKVAPEMQRIREQHKSDKQKQSMELMKLYKKEKINPLGGCLPILVQMPVFISLYYVLLESVELRQAPFFGWIVDLSVMDPYFILPLLMGASMWFQMQLNPAPQDPTQAQIMKWMPVVFTIFFLWFPAGLVLYWLTNNILSITQQWVITRNIAKE